jgi:hypothetical protein
VRSMRSAGCVNAAIAEPSYPPSIVRMQDGELELGWYPSLIGVDRRVIENVPGWSARYRSIDRYCFPWGLQFRVSHQNRRSAGGPQREGRLLLMRKALAEFIGTALLLIAVVGSGIAAQTLSPNDTGLELLENAAATGAALVAIILAVGPVSGVHLNRSSVPRTRSSAGSGRESWRRTPWPSLRAERSASSSPT